MERTRNAEAEPVDAYPASLLGAAEAMGELMEFWGFKRIHGALWTVLYLEPEPLTQQQLMARTGYSKGAVSMALSELADWHVVRITRPLKGRGRYYEAETDLGGMVRNVLKQREKGLLETAKDRFELALRDVEARRSPGDEIRGERLRQLVGLTAAALWTLERFLKRGTVPFSRLRAYFDRGLAASHRNTEQTRGGSN